MINVLDIEEDLFNKHVIRVYLPDRWKAKNVSYSPFMFPTMINENSLNVTMPWGVEALEFPLNDVIVFRQT